MHVNNVKTGKEKPEPTPRTTQAKDACRLFYLAGVVEDKAPDIGILAPGEQPLDMDRYPAIGWWINPD